MSTAECSERCRVAKRLDASLPHLNARDVTLMAISRAPIAKLVAYKRRMGWKFPYVSSHGNDFSVDVGFAATEEMMETGELAKLVNEPTTS